MVFPKLTRERIYKAQPQAVEITWPQDGPEPKKNRSYSVQTTKERAGEERVVVLAVKELPEGFKAEVKLETDPIRLLAKTSGYVTSPAGAMAIKSQGEKEIDKPQVEPEAVPAGYQRLLSEEARIENARKRGPMRERQKVLAKESELAASRPGSRGERAKRRHLESMDRGGE